MSDGTAHVEVVEVFADISCPFAHVGLRRFVAERSRRGLAAPLLRVRAWPLELVNGVPLDGKGLTAKVSALRATVAPDLFAGFDADRFPASTLPALAAEASAYRAGSAIGEAFSLDVRAALFEGGWDVGDPDVVARLLADAGLPPAGGADADAVAADHRIGVERGVIGSPHFFTPAGDFFCPSLRIEHRGAGIDIAFDTDGFEQFITAALA